MRYLAFLRFVWLTATMSLLILSGCGVAPDSQQVASRTERLCSNGALVSNVPGYNAQPGAQVLWTGSASCQFPNPEYAFWVQNPSGVWANVRAFSTDPTYTWDTTGQALGQWNWSLWAREAGSSTPYETYLGRPFNLMNDVACTAAAFTPSPASPGVKGSTVTITASASSCGTPQYQFWLQPPGSPYAIAQAYSSSPVFNWDTSSATVGTWAISVWVKAQGSNQAYEASTGQYYTITGSATCSAGTVTPSPSTQAVKGTQVTFTANAASCGTPQYQFWLQSPGGGYSIAQAFSASPTFTWDTSSVATGTWAVSVWMKQTGSPNAYDVAVNQYYSILGGAACSGATVGFAPSSPSKLGTQVTVTAGSSTCGAPQYQFWLQAPGQPYAIVQPFSSSPTFAWDTSALSSGLYSFSVWVKNTGSTSGYDTVTQSYYTLTYTATTPTSNFSAGLQNTCFLKADGTVACWGLLNSGNALTGQLISGLSGASLIGAGYYHTCAIVSGAVECWGTGSSGQLGDGTTSNSSTPVTAVGISTATALAGGAAHSCAALNDGTVKCWGYNSQGQTGSVGGTPTPTTVAGLSGVVAVSAGYYHSCALKSDGTVRCWGANSYGQLGNGTTTNSTPPVAVSGLQDVVSLASSSSHNCAVVSAGTVSCWGYNLGGQNGNGTSSNSSVPVVVTGITNAASVSVGPDTGCAVLKDGTARCWGLNPNGELGNGTTTASSTPVVVAGVSGIASVATGWHHTCARLTNGTAQCWGDGASYGQLGDGNATSSLTPVAVTLP